MVSYAVWKTWPSGLSNDKNLGLRPRFLSTESLGPCFSHGMGDHDQILQPNTISVNVCTTSNLLLNPTKCICGISLIIQSEEYFSWKCFRMEYTIQATIKIGWWPNSALSEFVSRNNTNDFFGHKWGNFPMTLICDTVMGQAYTGSWSSLQGMFFF